jgi:hypothetical protein
VRASIGGECTYVCVLCFEEEREGERKVELEEKQRGRGRRGGGRWA